MDGWMDGWMDRYIDSNSNNNYCNPIMIPIGNDCNLCFKNTESYGKIRHAVTGKTHELSMAIFNGYVKLPEGNRLYEHDYNKCQ